MQPHLQTRGSPTSSIVLVAVLKMDPTPRLPCCCASWGGCAAAAAADADADADAGALLPLLRLPAPWLLLLPPTPSAALTGPLAVSVRAAMRAPIADGPFSAPPAAAAVATGDPPAAGGLPTAASALLLPAAEARERVMTAYLYVKANAL
jgi:hypothetical protein